MKKYVALALAAVALVGVGLWWIGKPGEPIVIHQVPGPPQPRVPYTEEGFDPAAMAAAEKYAAARNTTALLVGRGGHVVYEKYWHGASADTVVETGFDPVLVALALGALVNDRVVPSVDMPLTYYLPADGNEDGAERPRTLRQLMTGGGPARQGDGHAELLVQALERAAGKPYEAIIAEEIWAPIGAGDVAFRRVARGPRAGGADPVCCLRARLGDWMRIGEALANDGVFEGNQLTPPRFANEMLSPVRADSAHGYFTRVDGRFATPGVAWLDGLNHQRLWVVPSLRLVILRIGGAPGPEGWDELMIPNTIIRGTSGWAPRRVEEGIDPAKYAPH